jgi:hypothetical protein
LSKANILDTRTVDYLELIGNGKTYRVPPYQRDYSWTEEQWEDLWNDMLELRGNPDSRHYMGALVVEAKNDREFSIIDGQQRMATLSILALAVIKQLEDLNSADPRNLERASELRKRFIGEKDPASLAESSKLFLNDTDNPFYQDYLVQLREPLNRSRLTKSNRLLWECFQYFGRQLGSLPGLQADGLATARILSEVVSRQLMFILIRVDDDLNAYLVFETLNARGLELTTTDLLKNYLFSRVRVGTDLDQLKRRWTALIGTVGQERFPEFLRYHLLTRQRQVRKQRLFKLVRDETRTPEEVFGLMTALEARAELFAAILDQNHGYWSERPEARPVIKELSLFGVTQMMPLVFAAWERMPDDFVRVLKIVSVVSFRYTVVSGLNTNLLEPVYHEAAKAVLEGIAKTPGQVFNQLRQLYVDDGRFSDNFANLTIDAAGQRKRLAKYILARIEADAASKTLDPDTDPATIEHILPANPNQDWAEDFAETHWDSSVDRLGNLTLLESSLNRRASNQAYRQKAALYEESAYFITKRVQALAPEAWTLALLNERQRQMAARAVHLWRCDFG